MPVTAACWSRRAPAATSSSAAPPRRALRPTRRRPGNPLVYVVLDPVVPGSEVPTGTTYGAVEVGVGGQSAVYALSFNPLTGQKTGPVRIDPQANGHQLFADVAADSGVVHVLWWDSRNDRCYSPARPVGNCADRTLTASLDAYGATLSPVA